MSVASIPRGPADRTGYTPGARIAWTDVTDRPQTGTILAVDDKTLLVKRDSRGQTRILWSADDLRLIDEPGEDSLGSLAAPIPANSGQEAANTAEYAARHNAEPLPAADRGSTYDGRKARTEMGYYNCPDNGHRDVVCLCGSTRFRAEFEEASRLLGLAGKIVLTVSCFGHSGDLPPEACQDGHPVKERLDNLHLRKIDFAERIVVIDPGGYVGTSTAREIAYAERLRRPILRWSDGSFREYVEREQVIYPEGGE